MAPGTLADKRKSAKIIKSVEGSRATIVYSTDCALVNREVADPTQFDLLFADKETDQAA